MISQFSLVAFLLVLPSARLFASEARCLESFDPFTSLQSNPRKAQTKEVQESLAAYAECAALSQRRPKECSLMRFYEGNGEKTCRTYFERLILFRDISAGAPLDILDSPMCRRLSALVLGAASLSPELCSAMVSSYKRRTPFCSSLGEAFPDRVKPKDVLECQADQTNFEKEGRSVLGADRYSSAVASLLWSGQKPTCGLFPHNGPQNTGACFGVFYPEKCADLLLTAKKSFCARKRRGY